MTISKKAAKILHKYYWWQWLLFFVGALTLLSIVGALFLAAGSEPPGHSISGDIPEVGDPMFITSLAGSLHAPSGTGPKVIPLKNGDNFRNELFAAIDGAEKSINFSVYIWTQGEFSDQLLSKLLAKQKSGVEVRILLDSLGSQSFDVDDFNPLKEAGGKVEIFRGVKFGQLTRYFHRNHRRAIVIDGKVGFTGGMAVGDTWLGNAANPQQWRDQMYRLSGSLAQALQGDFTDLWSGTTGEFLAGEKFYPTIQSSSDSKFVHVSQTPSADVQILPDFILVSIKAARKRLYIETPYFIPNAQLLDAVLDRAKNGVEVKMILPNKYNDIKLDRLASQYYYQKLLDAGVKIYEYSPTFNHTKFIVVDEKWSVIGSANLNTRSRRLDEENVFGILSEELGSQHEEIFYDDIKNSEEITKEAWKKRNKFRIPFEWLATVFDKQI